MNQANDSFLRGLLNLGRRLEPCCNLPSFGKPQGTNTSIPGATR
jgi:hypothetical protein